jgi:hypothetical protein
MANGILDIQLPGSKLGLKGTTPNTRAAANPGSTLHRESSINNNPEITAKPSNLDLNGVTPATRAGALATSQVHYKDELKAQAPNHSKFDFDGERPDAYYDNLPG